MRILILMIPILVALLPNGLLVGKAKSKPEKVVNAQPSPANVPADSPRPVYTTGVKKPDQEDIEFDSDFDIYDILSPGGKTDD